MRQLFDQIDMIRSGERDGEWMQDDRLGDPFQLCTSDFGQSGEDYVVRQEQAASFEASFFCGECAPLPPPPPPSPPPLPPPPPFPPPAPLVEEALVSIGPL